MQIFTLQATIGQQTTTRAIKARDNFSAKVLAVLLINVNFVSDKRWAIGEITLKSRDNKIIWKVPAEEGV